jgi:hypothetical protein
LSGFHFFVRTTDSDSHMALRKLTQFSPKKFLKNKASEN